MQPIAGGALARPFVTHHNALDMHLYLRIAPELYLKRLAVGGMERVFEINRNFRNEGISTQHNPEFTMMEFYQAYADYQDLMAMTEEMICDRRARRRSAPTQSRSASTRSRWRAPFARLSLREAAREAASQRGSGATSRRRSAEPRERRRRIARAARARGPARRTAPARSPPRSSSAVRRPAVQPTFVYDFPTEVSPLSKQKPDDPDTVERFELYIGGFEVANAFSELNDPVEQRRRFEAQLKDRAARRSRGARDGRGLHPRARIRPAADRRRRRRHRSAGHAADQQPVDPRCHPVSADEETQARSADLDGSSPSSCTSRSATCSPSASRRSSRSSR